jgi:transcriptional regulator GlxA family with amidase domain
LNRRIKNITGETTQHYVQNLRLEQARHLLQTTQMSVSEIGYRCGFEDATSFSRAFKRSFGQSPTQYKNEPKNA